MIIIIIVVTIIIIPMDVVVRTVCILLFPFCLSVGTISKIPPQFMLCSLLCHRGIEVLNYIIQGERAILTDD